MVSEQLGYVYHTGEVRDLEEARRIYRVVQGIVREAGA